MRTLLVGTVALLLCTERPPEAKTITAGIEIEQKVLNASPLETDVTVNIKAPSEHLNWVSFRYWHNSRDEPIGPKEERLEGTVTRSNGGPFIFHQEGKQPRMWLCTPLHKETDPP